MNTVTGEEDVITGFDVTQAGLPLSLETAETYGFNDNFIFPGEGELLDTQGFAFNDGSVTYNIFFSSFFGTYTECASNLTDCDDVSNGAVLSSFNMTPVGAPEPSTLMLLGSAVFGLIGFSRKRDRMVS